MRRLWDYIYELAFLGQKPISRAAVLPAQGLRCFLFFFLG